MPPRVFGRCDCCSRPDVWTTPIIGYDGDGRIFGGYVCAECHVALTRIREEKKKNRGESESQERTPRE